MEFFSWGGNITGHPWATAAAIINLTGSRVIHGIGGETSGHPCSGGRSVAEETDRRTDRHTNKQWITSLRKVPAMRRGKGLTCDSAYITDTWTVSKQAEGSTFSLGLRDMTRRVRDCLGC